VKPTSQVTVVRLYAFLRELAGERDVEVALPDGATVHDLISRLVELRPVLAERLLAVNDNAPRFVNILVNGKDIRDLDGLDTPVMSDDEVTILSPVGGG
jgi:molybdopterin synthase sulfur carrier subunit